MLLQKFDCEVSPWNASPPTALSTAPAPLQPATSEATAANAWPFTRIAGRFLAASLPPKESGAMTAACRTSFGIEVLPEVAAEQQLTLQEDILPAAGITAPGIKEQVSFKYWRGYDFLSGFWRVCRLQTESREGIHDIPVLAGASDPADLSARRFGSYYRQPLNPFSPGCASRAFLPPSTGHSHRGGTQRRAEYPSGSLLAPRTRLSLLPADRCG